MEAGAADTPCLWLRGLVPKSLTAVSTPYPVGQELTYLGEAPDGPWPGGVYWTDGSGGKYGSVKALRRCGSGIAVVVQDGDGRVRFKWGAFVPLHGELQTAPRAELNACITIPANVVQGGSVELVADSLVNYNILIKGLWRVLSLPITTCGFNFGVAPRGLDHIISR